MDWLKNLPRWALALFSMVGMMAVGVLLKNVYADQEKTKTVAYEARHTAENASLQIADLRGSIQDIKNAQDRDRQETRADFKEIREILLKPR